MAELSQADLIWNRACREEAVRSHPGDRALADLLYSHGLVMNGGVLHGVEHLTVDEISNAKAGYRYYGLDGVISLLSRARTIFEKGGDLGICEAELDGEYVKLIPCDSYLVESFENQLSSCPSDFAPLDAEDMA